jgi:four helix bundle protein
VQDFHKLRAWQKATRLAVAIRGLLATFPRRGYARLKNQMIGSSESIPDNIAEGCGTQTIPDFVRFLDSSIKSANELESQLDRSLGYRLMPQERWRLFAAEVQTVRKMTWGLRRSVLRGGIPTAEDLFADEGVTSGKLKNGQ